MKGADGFVATRESWSNVDSLHLLWGMSAGAGASWNETRLHIRKVTQHDLARTISIGDWEAPWAQIPSQEAMLFLGQNPIE
jgi:hypothetical protein